MCAHPYTSLSPSLFWAHLNKIPTPQEPEQDSHTTHLPPSTLGTPQARPCTPRALGFIFPQTPTPTHLCLPLNSGRPWTRLTFPHPDTHICLSSVCVCVYGSVLTGFLPSFPSQISVSDSDKRHILSHFVTFCHISGKDVTLSHTKIFFLTCDGNCH